MKDDLNAGKRKVFDATRVQQQRQVVKILTILATETPPNDDGFIPFIIYTNTHKYICKIEME